VPGHEDLLPGGEVLVVLPQGDLELLANLRDDLGVIPSGLRLQRLQALHGELQTGRPLREVLSEYLAPQELRAMQRRIDKLLAEGVFPSPSEDGYSYPWPPV
jgi:hypothetical protein